MKAVVTVIGCDQIGIIAGVTAILAEVNVNISDISQTLMDKYFTMIMMVDLSDACKDFKAIQEQLEQFGQSMNLSIRIQRQDIFDAMHDLSTNW